MSSSLLETLEASVKLLLQSPPSPLKVEELGVGTPATIVAVPVKQG